MKLFLASLGLLFCSNAYALDCPDFSGRYKWVDELDEGAFIKIDITQTDCNNLVEVHDQGWGFTIKKKHILDGKKYLVEDNGDFKAFETATMDESGLHVFEERQKLYENTVEFMKLDFIQPEPNQLVIHRVLYNSEMAPIEEDKTTYTRR